MSVAEKVVRAQWFPAALRVPGVDAVRASGREILSGSKCGGRANYPSASERMII